MDKKNHRQLIKIIMNVSDYIINRVAELGIDFIPIYQSGNALRLIDAAGKLSSDQRFDYCS